MSLCHVAMVEKFLDENKPKTSLKSEFALFQTTSILFNFILFVKCWRNFSGFESERTVSKFRKRQRKNSMLCSPTLLSGRVKLGSGGFISIVVVQRRLRNVQKGVLHVQRCCFANLNLLLFCRSRCRYRRFKLPIVVIQKVCYHSNVTSHFYLLKSGILPVLGILRN